MQQEITETFDQSKRSKALEQRNKLLRQAYKLRSQAWVRYGRFWNRLFRRDYRKSREWQRSQELDRQADLIDVPLEGQLRSVALKPDGSLEGARTDEERQVLVRMITAKRSDLLGVHPQSALPSMGDLRGGRLLLYVPSENMNDGASAMSSAGFFDDYDAPPWDLWVAFSAGIMLSWVPAQLIELAQSGIDANAGDCIRWMG